jgi:radical SAM protein with 4Fe4S-binding SPASM domain
MVTSTFQFSFYGEDATQPMNDAETDTLFEHYLAVARAILGGDRTMAKLGTVAEVLAGITFKRKRQFQCGAGRQFWAVASAGDVYPCHRFVGMSPYRIGNVTDPTFAFASLPLFEANGVASRVVKSSGHNNCSICFAHNICGGGCAQIAAANTGRVGELPTFYCQDTRLRVKAVVRAIVESTSK